MSEATTAVWRKRLLQLPWCGFNLRHWAFGVSWDAPADEGYFTLHLGPIGLCWDMWP